MHRSLSSPLRRGLFAAAIAVGCSSNVQDLGHAADAAAIEEPNPGLEGEGALVPPTRSVACTLSRPIEGAECGPENGAPCTFVGAPEASPDQRATPIHLTTTFCICTAERRWSCLERITMKTLLAPLAAGDPCERGLELTRDGITCDCATGVARCRP